MFSLWSNFALDSSAGTAVNSADASEASTELTGEGPSASAPTSARPAASHSRDEREPPRASGPADLNIASWKEIFGDGHAGHPLSSHQEPVEASDGGISRGTTPTGQGDVAWPYKGAASAREEAVEGRVRRRPESMPVDLAWEGPLADPLLSVSRPQQGGVHSGGVPSLPLPPTAHAMHDGGNAVDIDWQVPRSPAGPLC